MHFFLRSTAVAYGEIVLKEISTAEGKVQAKTSKYWSCKGRTSCKNFILGMTNSWPQKGGKKKKKARVIEIAHTLVSLRSGCLLIITSETGQTNVYEEVWPAITSI